MWVCGGVEEEKELETRKEVGGKGNRFSGGGPNEIGSKGETKREREGKRENGGGIKETSRNNVCQCFKGGG